MGYFKRFDMIFISWESLEFYIRGAVKSGFLNGLFDESLFIYCHDLWIDLWIVVSVLCAKMFFPFIRNELLI